VNATVTRTYESAYRGDRPIEVESVDYHRNGSGGQGFFAVMFRCTIDSEDRARRFIATVVDSEDIKGFCFVLDADLVGEGESRFGYNSWRGDTFETQCRAAIADYRVGFCWPPKEA
jgi:hypothetical protein